MRIDKLTTKFQEALADAQSLAVTRDNPYIEPAHLLAAMLAQADGPKALLDRAGANSTALKTALDTLINGFPQVQGSGQVVQPSRDLTALLQATEKEAGKRGDQFIASERQALMAGHIGQAPAHEALHADHGVLRVFGLLGPGIKADLAAVVIQIGRAHV